jgi:hypothetical protein
MKTGKARHLRKKKHKHFLRNPLKCLNADLSKHYAAHMHAMLCEVNNMIYAPTGLRIKKVNSKHARRKLARGYGATQKPAEET